MTCPYCNHDQLKRIYFPSDRCRSPRGFILPSAVDRCLKCDRDVLVKEVTLVEVQKVVQRQKIPGFSHQLQFFDATDHITFTGR